MNQRCWSSFNVICSDHTNPSLEFQLYDSNRCFFSGWLQANIWCLFIENHFGFVSKCSEKIALATALVSSTIKHQTSVSKQSSTIGLSSFVPLRLFFFFWHWGVRLIQIHWFLLIHTCVSVCVQVDNHRPSCSQPKFVSQSLTFVDSDLIPPC